MFIHFIPLLSANADDIFDEGETEFGYRYQFFSCNLLRYCYCYSVITYIGFSDSLNIGSLDYFVKSFIYIGCIFYAGKM